MNAEVFANWVEKCGLFTTLLGQNVENLDEYGCPKNQILVEERKADSSWMCSIYRFRYKTKLLCAERKAKVYGEGPMQHLNLWILYVFILFMFTTNSTLRARQDFSLAFSLKKLSLQSEMPDHTDNINRDEIVFHDQNVEKRSWFCLG